MNTRAFAFVLVLAALLVAVRLVLGGGEAQGDRAAPAAQEAGTLLELRSVAEPSGIVFHPARGTLFVVDDGGVLCEFTPDGRVVRQAPLRDADFEGITIDPSTGLLYIAIEGAESLLEVDPETFGTLREFALPRAFEGRTLMKEGGQGIEAVTFVPDDAHPHGGTFFVANQSMRLDRRPEDLSVIVEAELPLRSAGAEPGAARILRYFLPGVADVAGLHFDAERRVLLAASDATDRLLVLALDGRLLASRDLPGQDQEGIAVDSTGRLFIAQDSGGVLRVEPGWDDRFESALPDGDF
jgi:sugar lactone lactonase YvrE